MPVLPTRSAEAEHGSHFRSASISGRDVAVAGANDAELLAGVFDRLGLDGRFVCDMDAVLSFTDTR